VARPPSRGVAARHQLHVRFTPHEWGLLTRLAARRALTMLDTVRALLAEAYDREGLVASSLRPGRPLEPRLTTRKARCRALNPSGVKCQRVAGPGGYCEKHALGA
jgi:hypothetical protein